MSIISRITAIGLLASFSAGCAIPVSNAQRIANLLALDQECTRKVRALTDIAIDSEKKYDQNKSLPRSVNVNTPFLNESMLRCVNEGLWIETGKRYQLWRSLDTNYNYQLRNVLEGPLD